jgi:hypothetical protein
MAGIIVVAPGAVWSTSSWMFRYVLKTIAAETSDPELAASLTEIRDENLPGLSLPDLPDGQRAEVERIIRDRLVPRTERELPETTQNRAAIIDHVRGLSDMLASAAGRP